MRLNRSLTANSRGGPFAPYLGTKWSNASFSADELVALSRGFDLPLGWFFTPPPPSEDAGVAVPDAGMLNGTDPQLLLEVVSTLEGRLPSPTSARSPTVPNARSLMDRASLGTRTSRRCSPGASPT